MTTIDELKQDKFFTGSKLFWTVVYDMMFIGALVSVVACYTGYQQFWLKRSAFMIGSVEAVSSDANEAAVNAAIDEGLAADREQAKKYDRKTNTWRK